MRVVYEDPAIIKRIQKAVEDAERANRRIGYIELTVSEVNELSDYVRTRLWLGPSDLGNFRYYRADDAGKVVGKFYGAEIRVEKPA
jgi:hypothetical protein